MHALRGLDTSANPVLRRLLILLALQGQDGHWTSASAADMLMVDPRSVDEALDELASVALLKSDATGYASSGPSSRALIVGWMRCEVTVSASLLAAERFEHDLATGDELRRTIELLSHARQTWSTDEVLARLSGSSEKLHALLALRFSDEAVPACDCWGPAVERLLRAAHMSLERVGAEANTPLGPDR